MGGLDQKAYPEYSHKGIWTRGVPSNVNFFLWTITLDKFLTLNHLKCREWNWVNKWVMCLREEKTTDHLFIHYHMMREICLFFLSHLNISWVFPHLFRDLISE